MTRVIEVDPLNIDSSLILNAARVIKNGGLVAFPTETVYGVGADVFNEDAIKKIFASKARPSNKPLAVCISSSGQLGQIASVIPKEAELLADRFLPGPLTLVLPKKNTIPNVVTAYSNSVGVRCPDNKIALSLIEKAATPIVATSANISGKPSPCTAKEVLRQMLDKIDLVIDGGPTRLKIPSTIVDFTSSPYRVLREGALSKEAINQFLQEQGFVPLEIVK